MANPARNNSPARTPRAAPVVSLHRLRAHCCACSMRELCLPVDLSPQELNQVDAIVGQHIKLRRGDTAYRVGQPFGALYAVRVGTLKSKIFDEEGREQVLGFHLPGDVIGLDGIGTGRHGCEAIALEDSELCVLPFDRIEQLAEEIPPLRRNLYRFLSREITRDQDNLLMLGSMRAEERLAAFLIDLSERYRRRGCSSREFNLRMTRDEIGSFIGLKLETVSRLFSRFQEEGLLQVQGRAVKLLDVPGLRQLLGMAARPAAAAKP